MTQSLFVGHSKLIAVLMVLLAGLAALAVYGFSQAQAAGHIGPTGRYYVTDESGFNKVWQFQGNTLSSFPTVPLGAADGPILVDGNTNTVRSVKGGFVGGSPAVPGSEYDFAGVVQGPLGLDFSAYGGYGRVIDAAFDGTNAYIVSGLFGRAGVFRYNADFSGPGVLLFHLPGAAQSTSQGITYDTTTNTLWTSDYNVFSDPALGGYVRQWSLAGVELFSFPVVDAAGVSSERNTALAYDFSDDTFWMNAHVENTLGIGIGELWQFDRNGNFLQKIHAKQFDPSAPANILYWGGEIRATGQPHGLDVDIDVKPTSCPNPLNVGKRGVLPAAILGTDTVDVSQVDVATVQLEGVAPLRSNIEDVATPHSGGISDPPGREDCT
ncbi:MAG: hypothetical protein O3A47_09720, partial [Chloroflexi bacterium]|nr:hypothetical protein [Chloroflexota bacterium]